MSKYGWMLKLSDELGGQEIYGPSALSRELNNELLVGNGAEFKVYDNDDILCGIGRIVGDYEGFEPMDDYATPSLGCTKIQYKQLNGMWMTL